MRKTILIGLIVAAAVCFAPPPASALVLPGGTYIGKFIDYGSFFNGDTPQPVVYYDARTQSVINEPVVGYEDRTIVWIDSLTNLDIPAKVFTGGQGLELMGMVYDLQVTSVSYLDSGGNVTGVEANAYGIRVELGNTPRYDDAGYTGGRVDFWSSTDTDFPELSPAAPSNWVANNPGATFTDPANWALDGNHDEFPELDGKTDPSNDPVLTGTLVSPGTGTPLLSLTLWLRDTTIGGISLKAGSGSSSLALCQVLAGGFGFPFAEFLTTEGEVYNITFENTFTFYPNPLRPDEGPVDNPLTTDVWWDTRSDDPALFSLVPEPCTLSLLGLALVGLGGVMRRRKK